MLHHMVAPKQGSGMHTCVPAAAALQELYVLALPSATELPLASSVRQAQDHV